MSEANAILEQCRAAGLRVEREGHCLLIRPADRVAPELLETIRAHKPELMALLGGVVPPSPWHHVARQVLAGEFDGGPGSLLESVRIGIGCSDHPDCREAVARLEVLQGKRGRVPR